MSNAPRRQNACRDLPRAAAALVSAVVAVSYENSFFVYVSWQVSKSLNEQAPPSVTLSFIRDVVCSIFPLSTSISWCTLSLIDRPYKLLQYVREFSLHSEHPYHKSNSLRILMPSQRHRSRALANSPRQNTFEMAEKRMIFCSGCTHTTIIFIAATTYM